MAKQRESGLAIAGALFWCAAGVLACIGLDPSKQSVGWLVVLHAGLLFSAWWYWRFSYWGAAGNLGFGGAVLLAGVLFRVLAIIDTAAYGLRLDQWPPAASEALFESSIIAGEVVTWAGQLLMVIAWRMALKWKYDAAAIVAGRRGNGEAQVFWLLALGVLATGSVFSKVGSAFGTLLPTIFILGVVAVAYLPVVANSVGWRKAAAAFLFGLPFAAAGLRSGMKSEIFLPLLPAAVFWWFAIRHPLVRFVTVIFGGMLLVVSQGYVYYVRATTWGSKIEKPALELILSYLDATAGHRGEALLDAMESVSARINLTNSHAATMAVTEQSGFLPDKVYLPIPLVFIPRVLWPDKPSFVPGVEHNPRYRGYRNIENAGTSTAAGFPTEQYMGAGVIGLVLGAITFGYLVGALQRGLSGLGSTVTLNIYNLVMLHSAIRQDENTPVYAYSGLVALFLITYAVAKATGVFMQRAREGAEAGRHADEAEAAARTRRL